MPDQGYVLPSGLKKLAPFSTLVQNGLNFAIFTWLSRDPRNVWGRGIVYVSISNTIVGTNSKERFLLATLTRFSIRRKVTGGEMGLTISNLFQSLFGKKSMRILMGVFSSRHSFFSFLCMYFFFSCPDQSAWMLRGRPPFCISLSWAKL